MKKLIFAAAVLLLAGNYAFAQNATIAGGSSTPSGAAGGTLGGTYPNPSIAATITPATSIGIGNATPAAPLDLNVNLTSSPALVVSTSLARMQAADTAVGGMEFVSYGAASANVLVGAVAGGTSAAKTATPAIRNMLSSRGYGWNGTTWQIGGLFSIHSSSVGAWSGTNQGTQIDFFTTPDNTTAVAVGGSFAPSGGFNIGSTLPTLSAAELGLNKTTASGTAPGAGTAKMAWVTGTNAGSCKLISYAGTSTTPVTIVDNVGTGC